MKSFRLFPKQDRPRIKYILTDIDDTLTWKGRLPARAYSAMEALERSGRQVIPITGRPAGWCDHIARMWPVAGVVGENGAFAFAYDRQRHTMQRWYWKSEKERQQDRIKLEHLKTEILEKVPGCRVSVDQPYREADLAIDFCEDVSPLSAIETERIVHIFEQGGARAKISSIHVNGWFGEYDKLSMTRLFFHHVFQADLEALRSDILYIGDSPNDSPMFAFFPQSVGVANIVDFKDSLPSEPAWITATPGGYGFAEMAEILLNTRLSAEEEAETGNRVS